MLNRRTLRIKAMQTIFAFRQSREANFGIALDFINEIFSPDLNSMEVQDKALLDEQKKEALKIFKENFKQNSFHGNTDTIDKVNNAVSEAIDQYHQNVKKDYRFFKKSMVTEAEKILDRYLSILNLIIAFSELASEDNRLNHKNFVKNLLIKALKFNNSLETISLRQNINWDKNPVVRQWFKELLKTDESYLDYLKIAEPGREDDKAIINHIVKDIIFKNETIDKYMEDQDLNWSEDRAIIKSLTSKTVKSIIAEGEDFELQELSYNWEDDKSFFIKLFEETSVVETQYEELIVKRSKNWDIERIAITDRIILDMAISEMINFSSIPVKVTINEYIEIVKKYSTPKSKTFVNGMLDVIANDLLESGAVKKSGRGLIDNK